MTTSRQKFMDKRLLQKAFHLDNNASFVTSRNQQFVRLHIRFQRRIFVNNTIGIGYDVPTVIG